MGRIQFGHSYEEVISLENLLEAWKEFKRGKGRKEGVQHFQVRLMEHILALHGDLRNKTYQHGPYRHFKIADPKPRDIHKASVRDRLLHHALYRKLYPFFDRTFISDSFSCRLDKGTHRAMNRFRTFAYKASKNHTRTCFVLKCGIRKFFANIDHSVLTGILQKHISDKNTLWLLGQVIKSFQTEREKGLPLGNLTSQLLVNIYMNELDQFVKHKLKIRYYIRYADDFVILSHNKRELERLLPLVERFLRERLKLVFHPDKIFIKTFATGTDFLGWVHFPNHRVIRTATKRRMFKRLKKSVREETMQSYLGLLKHGNTYKIRNKLTGFDFADSVEARQFLPPR